MIYHFAFDFFVVVIVCAFFDVTFSAEKNCVYSGGEEVCEELLDCDHQLDQQCFEEQECDKEDISQEKKGCEDETPGQINGEMPRLEFGMFRPCLDVIL